MPSSDPPQHFADIVENIDYIERFTQGLDATTFATNHQVVFAVKYALMIISEAAIRLGDIAGTLQPGIPWRDNIDLTRIWLLIERDLPPLKSACQDALRALSGDTPAS